MRNLEKKKIITIIILFLVFLSCVLLVFARLITNVVQQNIEEEMREIASHDKLNIQACNESRWTDLAQMAYRIQVNKPQTIEELCLRLNMESPNDVYEKILLVDDQGITYSYTGNVSDGNGTSPVEHILNGDDKFAVLFRTGNVIELYIDTLVYGVSFDPIQVDGRNIIGIYALTDYYSIEKQLKITSFNNQGSTTIFDSDGYFIVQNSNQINVAKRDNVYDVLTDFYSVGEDELTEMKEMLTANTSFSKIFTDDDNEKTFVYYTAVADTDWTMALEVPYKSIQRTTRVFMNRTFIMVSIIVIVLIFMMWSALKSAVTASKAVANAKARTDFLSTMSHEIRTPLNGIIGLNHLMQSNIGNEEKLLSYLKKSAATEEYLLSLINDILDVQKLQAEKVDAINEPFSLQYLVDSMESIMRPRMEDKDINFTVNADIQESHLIGDATKIQQIIINILSNASKFTPEGGLVEFRVSQTPAAEGSITTLFEIEDNGCGMSEEFQKNIFESFTQERSAIGDSIKGTGLGMNISMLLAKSMHALLTVDSELGKGSCFRLMLSNDISEEASSHVGVLAGEAYEVASAEEKSLHILVAEDNELNAEILMEILKEFGHTAELAGDGVKAVEIFSASEPGYFDLILMDIQMPNMNGYEATKAIRALDRPDAKSVLIFACTANTFKEDMDTALAVGMDDFIGKPIDVNVLMNKLRNR